MRTPITQFIASSYIYSEPYGVVLIMSPWNYPFQLAIGPLVGAIAAGNCAVLKPSELSPNTSNVIEKLIGHYFDPSYVSVVKGGIEVNQAILKEKFDYVFFTGSTLVGKIVMEAAAKHLTPVTLELGGKSPCIVDRTANLDLAAKRIAWGKFINAGQTCVAPDYLLVHHSVKEALLSKIQASVLNFYDKDPCSNGEYTKIVNERHFNRLLQLMKCGRIVYGGNYNEKTNHIAPTIIDSVTWEDPIMQEEIFGPLLPVLEFKDLKEAVKMIKKKPKPLALYLFSTDKRNEQYVMKSASFGGGCINDTIIHLATPYMSFGGVGESGMGSYHGKYSFDTFSHKKSIMKKSNLYDMPLRYPPYKNNIKLLKKVMK